MTTPHLIPDLERDEGVVVTAYPDPNSALAKACQKAGISPIHYERLAGWEKLSGDPWTIGMGHTGREVHPGLVWTLAECRDAAARDVGHAIQGIARALPWWRKLCDARQDVLVNVAFNTGVGGLLKFRHMLAAAEQGDYVNAHYELLDSDAARDLPGRYHRLADQMRDGLRPTGP